MMPDEGASNRSPTIANKKEQTAKCQQPRVVIIMRFTIFPHSGFKGQYSEDGR